MEFKTALTTLVNTPNTFTLFMAPMGWGKTRMVWDLLESNNKIVFLCPLRSIVEELAKRDNVFCKREMINFKESYKEFLISKKGILVATVESLNSEMLRELIASDYLFVLDEFHLFYEWGRDFREKLFDIFSDLAVSKSRIMGLTATADLEFLDDLREDLNRNDKQAYFVDVGNFQLKFDPLCTVKSSKSIIKKKFLIHSYYFHRGRILCFFKTKKELYEMKELLRRRGIGCSVCVGGKVSEFVAKELRPKRIILATSALSHGVNIKNVRRVFLLYNPQKYLRFQMVGRGGRFGEGFKVYEPDDEDEKIGLVKRLKLYFKELSMNFFLELTELLI